MRAAKKVIPVVEGIGDLKFPGFNGEVQYQIAGEPARLKQGMDRLRGSITATTEVAEAAFHAGEGMLRLATGELLRLTMLGHTAGEPEIFIEARV
jgi:hypothetical protein